MNCKKLTKKGLICDIKNWFGDNCYIEVSTKIEKKHYIKLLNNCNDGSLYLCDQIVPFKKTKSKIGINLYIYDLYIVVNGKCSEFAVYHSDLDSDMELVLGEMGVKKQIKNKALKELLQSNPILDI